MNFWKAILAVAAVILGFSQSYAVDPTRLATGIAIGTATDNMALGLAIAVALDSDRPTKETYTYELDEKLSDGKKQILLSEATLFYRGFLVLIRK